jgi:hypothetical protein
LSHVNRRKLSRYGDTVDDPLLSIAGNENGSALHDGDIDKTGDRVIVIGLSPCSPLRPSAQRLGFAGWNQDPIVAKTSASLRMRPCRQNGSWAELP